MTASFFAAVANSGSNSTATAAPITLPTGVAGMRARLIVVVPNNTATITAPVGWIQVGTPLTGVGQPLQSVLFRRALTAADDGTTVSVPFSPASRFAVAVNIEANAVGQDSTTGQTTTGGTSQTIPATGAATAASQEVALVGYTVAANTGATPPTGWTLRAESWTSNSSGRRQGVQVLTRDVTVASGATGGSATITAVDTDARSQVFTALFSDAPVLAPTAGWVVGAIAMRSSA